jgi:hypothetical protein
MTENYSAPQKISSPAFVRPAVPRHVFLEKDAGEIAGFFVSSARWLFSI